jgi:putative Mg2+ transporter-C (MgtC) family protein
MLPDWELVIRLLVAAVLGSLIGADRERLVWAAGLRTHMLVCVGACLFMIVSAFAFSDILKVQNVVLDPSRVAAQVVSGIGFLGAGSILLRGEVVRGLTTAASLWSVAAIGLAVGGGLYIEAVAATLIILIILVAVKPLEEALQKRHRRFQIRLRTNRGEMPVSVINSILGYRSRRIAQFVSTAADDGRFDEIDITFVRISRDDISEIVDILKAAPGVLEVMAPTL